MGQLNGNRETHGSWLRFDRVALGSFAAAVVFSKIAAWTHLISPATSFFIFLGAVAMLFAATLAESILERMKLVEPAPASSALIDDVIVVRPPPPIREPAQPAAPTPRAVPAPGGKLPAGSATWGLEGGYEWRSEAQR
jgi:hypothetical protein